MTAFQQTGHFGEDALERFLLSPDSIDGRARREIELHLEACGLCAGAHRDLAAMHVAIDENLGIGPTEEDGRFAGRLTPAKRKILPAQGLQRVPDEALEGYAEVVEPTGR